MQNTVIYKPNFINFNFQFFIAECCGKLNDWYLYVIYFECSYNSVSKCPCLNSLRALQVDRRILVTAIYWRPVLINSKPFPLSLTPFEFRTSIVLNSDHHLQSCSPVFHSIFAVDSDLHMFGTYIQILLTNKIDVF